MAMARPPSKWPAVPDDQWRIPDALWGRMERLLPPRPPQDQSPDGGTQQNVGGNMQ